MKLDDFLGALHSDDCNIYICDYATEDALSEIGDIRKLTGSEALNSIGLMADFVLRNSRHYYRPHVFLNDKYASAKIFMMFAVKDGLIICLEEKECDDNESS